MTAINGDDLGDAIATGLDGVTGVLTGAQATARTALCRAIGNAVIAHLTARPPTAAVQGLVPALGGGSASDMLRRDLTWGTASGGSLSDGDYGDIVVSSSGSAMSIDSGVATTAGRAIMAGANAAAQRTSLGLGTAAVVDTGTGGANVPTITQADARYQPLDAELTALAALSSSAGILRQTGAGTFVKLSDTVAGRALLEAADVAAQITALGLAALYQPLDSDLTSLAALGSAADKLAYTTAAHTWAEATFTAAGRALVDDADAAAQRTTLGLGTAAVLASGVASAGDLPTRADADARYLGINAAQWGAGGIVAPWCPVTTSTGVQLNIGSTLCPAWYFGRAPHAITSIKAVVKVISSMSGITWAEMFLAKGSFTAVGNQTLTIVGYASIASLTATANVSTTISVSGGQSIAAGDDLWWGFAKSSTGTPGFRGASFGDDMLRGLILDGGNVQPSTIVGTPTSFTAVTTACPWFIVYPS